MDHRADPVKGVRPGADRPDRGSVSASVSWVGPTLWALAVPRDPLARVVPDRPAPERLEPRKPDPTGFARAQGDPRGRARHALPGVVAGQGILELSHFENLPQRIPIVLAAGLIAAAAIGLGDLVIGRLRLRDRLGLGERIALDYGVGTAFLGVATLLVGRMGWLDPRFIRTGLGLIAILGLISAWPRESPTDDQDSRTAAGEATPGSSAARPPERPARMALHARDRSIRDPHDSWVDAACHRLRRPRVPPGGPEGVLPGGADQLSCHTTCIRTCPSAWRCSTCSGWS